MPFPTTGVIRLVLTAAASGALLAVAAQSGSTFDARPTTPQGATSAGTQTIALDRRVLTCPDQELMGAEGVPDVSVKGSVTAAVPPRSVFSKAPEGSGEASLAAPGGQRAATSDAGKPLSIPLPDKGTGPVVVNGTGGLAPGLTAGQEWSADTKTLRGLAGAPCVGAAVDQWIVAGGGAPGRQERLVLSNPGANEVTVTLAVLGAKGAVAAGSNRGIVVPGNGRVGVLVDAIAGSEPSPVVKVHAEGGTVSAVITDTWLDGSVPAGAETVAAAAAPATRLVVPVASLRQQGALRIAVPGDTQAVVSARLLTDKGAVPLDKGGVQRVQPQSVLELPLSSEQPGPYAVEIRSDVPVIAGAFSVARDAGAVGDYAWSSAAEEIKGIAGATFPTGDNTPKRQVSLVASGSALTARVDLVDASGKVTSREVKVAADAIAVLDAGSPSSVWVRRVSGEGQLRGGILSSTGEGKDALISALTLTDLPTSTTATTAIPLP